MRRKDRISHEILSWYLENGRDLPWRRTRDPYLIWVSEVMLQQTRVDTVIPYYFRFVTKFPDIRALAEAPLQEVLRTWENLGYYGRARRLHRAAAEVASKFDGRIPSCREEFLRLPGVGPYTAGAVLSAAFGRRLPAVDGNVTRVISRLFAIQDPIEKNGTMKQIFLLAEELVPSRDPGRHNQAMMDLGAMVCTPKAPRCHECPVKGLCSAYGQGIQKGLPTKRKSKALPHKDMLAAVIFDKEGRLLIVQRPENGLLGGLWKLPGGEKLPHEDPGQALRGCVQGEVGVEVRVGNAVGSVRHAYTHFRITLHAYVCKAEGGRPRNLGCATTRWVRRTHLVRFPFSRVDRKILSLL